MIALGEPLPPSWRGRPPAMLDEDVPVWHTFLDRRGSEFRHFWYNVRITAEDLRARFKDPELLSIAEALVPKRIDAVGDRADGLWIIEVAALPGRRAIGQVLTYLALWRHERPQDRTRTRPVIVAGTCPEDERITAAAAGIEVICVGD